MASGIDIEMGPWLDTFSGELRYSLNRFQGDGVTTQWAIQFAGGYIDSTHVKAYSIDPLTSISEALTLTFISPYLVEVTPAVAASKRLVIYRDTPKATPLVNFEDGAVYNERNMDKVVSQSVFVAAEVTDSASVALEAAIAAAGAAGEVSTTAIAAAATAVSEAAAAAASAVLAAASAVDAAASAASIDPSVYLTKAGNLSDIADPATALATLGGEPADATILKAADIGVAVQAHDADTAKLDVAQSWAAPQNASGQSGTSLTVDLASGQDVTSLTPGAGGALTFTNKAAGRHGTIFFNNAGGYAITKPANTYTASDFLTTISAAGIYTISYWCPDGTNIVLSTTPALSTS